MPLRSQHSARRLGHALVPALAAAALAGAAHADVTDAYWINNGTYHYRVVHMPDLDQRRTVLSNDGANHCVPTSSMNLFAYAANHGYSFMRPFPGNWELSSQYSDASNAIKDLGIMMNTSGATGTTGSGNNSGVNQWLAQYSSGLVTQVRRSLNSDYTPTISKMIQLACQGWMMSFAYGRYDTIGFLNGVPILDRTGGHAVTLIRAKRDTISYFLRYRDPADDTHLSSQSEFAYKNVYPIAFTGYYGNQGQRTMNAISYNPSTGKVRVIDSYWGIRPTYGYFLNSSANLMGASGGTIRLVDPVPFEGGLNLSAPQITVSNFVTVEHLELSSDLTAGLVLTRSIFAGQPSKLQQIDLITGQFTPLTNAPDDLAGIAPSRSHSIYAFDALGKLYRLSEDGTIQQATSAVPTPSAIDFDNTNDRLALLSVSQRRIAKCDPNLAVVENIIVPTSVPMSGDGSVRVDPTTGRAWFRTGGSNTIYNVTNSIAGTAVVTLTLPPLIGGYNDFRFDAEGRLYLTGDNGTRVMRKTGITTWVLDANSPFHGGTGGTMFVISRGNTNEDPAIHDTLAWQNIPADQLEPIGEDHMDCDADLNGDDMVDGADLGIFLGAWGATRGAADLNQDGLVDGNDLGLLLGAWGGCP